MTYFITRWKHPDTGKWHTSTMQDKPTLAQAEEQHIADIRYFYSDIETQLVQVEETVVKTAKGSQTR